jgi:RNA polymerase sigma factor (sigma-70 family)
MQPVRDNDLLASYVATRDERAFAQLVARHLDWIYSAALRLTRDRTLAEDVAQGVFLALSQKAAKLTSHPNLAGWLFQATHFAARTALRAQRRRRALEKRAMQENKPTSSDEPLDRYWGQVKDRLEDAVARLRGSDRELIVLRFYQGHTLAEVGDLLGIEEEAARKRVSRALEKLRERLGGDTTVTLSAALAAHAVMKAPAALSAAILAPAHAAAGAGALAAAHAVQTSMTLAKLQAAAAVLLSISVLAAVIGGTVARFARGASPSQPQQLVLNSPPAPPAAAQTPFVFKPPVTPAPTGRLHNVTFTERSPYSPFEELSKHGQFKFMRPYDRSWASPEFLARDDKLRADSQYDLANESFEVFVPPAYKPTVPMGLFVWISAGAAELPVGWDDVLIRHRLIWISANNTGNARPELIRAGLALDAAHNMRQRYDLDPDRIYVSGFSGGGSVATMLMTGFPDVYRGVMPMCGGGFVGGRVTKDRKFEAGAGYMAIDGDPAWVKKNIKIVQIEGAVDPGVWPPPTRSPGTRCSWKASSATPAFGCPEWATRFPALSGSTTASRPSNRNRKSSPRPPRRPIPTPAPARSVRPNASSSAART